MKVKSAIIGLPGIYVAGLLFVISLLKGKET